jgi:hypothetical protein
MLHIGPEVYCVLCTFSVCTNQCEVYTISYLILQAVAIELILATLSSNPIVIAAP